MKTTQRDLCGQGWSRSVWHGVVRDEWDPTCLSYLQASLRSMHINMLNYYHTDRKVAQVSLRITQQPCWGLSQTSVANGSSGASFSFLPWDVFSPPQWTWLCHSCVQMTPLFLQFLHLLRRWHCADRVETWGYCTARWPNINCHVPYGDRVSREVEWCNFNTNKAIFSLDSKKLIFFSLSLFFLI